MSDNYKTYLHACSRYDIMLMCWNEQAQERPSFSDLRSKFDAMLLEEQKDEYIDFEVHNVDQSKLSYQKFSPAIEESVPCHA